MIWKFKPSQWGIQGRGIWGGKGGEAPTPPTHTTPRTKISSKNMFVKLLIGLIKQILGILAAKTKTFKSCPWSYFFICYSSSKQ